MGTHGLLLYNQQMTSIHCLIFTFIMPSQGDRNFSTPPLPSCSSPRRPDHSPSFIAGPFSAVARRPPTIAIVSLFLLPEFWSPTQVLSFLPASLAKPPRLPSQRSHDLTRGHFPRCKQPYTLTIGSHDLLTGPPCLFVQCIWRRCRHNLCNPHITQLPRSRRRPQPRRLACPQSGARVSTV